MDGEQAARLIALVEQGVSYLSWVHWLLWVFLAFVFTGVVFQKAGMSTGWRLGRKGGSDE